MKKTNISATIFYEYVVCKRKVWLLSRQIRGEQENDFLILGRMIHTNSYKREKKEIIFDNCKIDLIKGKGSSVVVGEIKSSSKSLDSSIAQIKYYLYILKKKGFNLKGEILVPKEKKDIKIDLLPEDIEKIKIQIKEIEEIINLEKPPEPTKCKYCKNCSYGEFCWC